MRRPLASPPGTDGMWTRTGPLRLESLRFAGLSRLKSRREARSPFPAAARKPLTPDGICWVAMAFRAGKRASAVPKTGSALHHLVTALSVKKALMDRARFGAIFSHLPATSGVRKTGDAPRTHSGKMRGGTGLPDCVGTKVKE